jgi:hypothetical protein
MLAFIGEQYGVPLAVVRELLARYADPAAPAPPRRLPSGHPDALSGARKWAGRMVRAGLVRCEVALGHTWVVPTRAGLRFAGLDFKPWQPAGFKLAHVEAVARLRLRLEEFYPGSTWTSERAIRSRWAGSGARVRYADGQLDLPDGTCVGIEVELHHKKAWSYESIAGDVDPVFDVIWWFCPVATVALLRRTLAAIAKPDRPKHEVYALSGELAGVLP